jgi:hypothetical protein
MQLFLSGVTMGRTNMSSYLVVGKSVAVPSVKTAWLFTVGSRVRTRYELYHLCRF